MLLHQKKPKACPCDVCATARKFYRLTARLPEKDREWLRDFHDYMVEGNSEELQSLRVTNALLESYVAN